jgi:serine/threonine protein kinase
VKVAVAPETSAEALNVLREIDCFSSIKHPNVLPFLGACLSDSERCLLVTEYMPGGNLKDWLYGMPGARKPRRKLSERLRMALHVCLQSFLCYLSHYMSVVVALSAARLVQGCFTGALHIH